MSVPGLGREGTSGPTTVATSATAAATAEATPYRQIRAVYDEETITVYQAYSSAIGEAAVQAQRLDASPDFLLEGRMTWIKPSWNWMMYRSGYSYKDARQARILAIKMRHGDFFNLLRRAELTHGKHGVERAKVDNTTVVDHDTGEDVGGGGREDEADQGKGGEEGSGAGSKVKKQQARREARARGERSVNVKVQWDPERTPRLEKLNYRSIQIGIPAALMRQWVHEWIVGIEDVTDRARELKKAVDDDEQVTTAQLVQRGLVPDEREFVVPDDVQRLLEMV